MDYGHAEAAHKYGSDPRKYNVMSKKFITDDQGHVRVRTVLVTDSSFLVTAQQQCDNNECHICQPDQMS